MARIKNKNLKSPNEETSYSYKQVEELKRCASDPVYFVKNYVQIQHPIKGAIPFNLYPYQVEMLKAYQDNKSTVVLSARQTGKSITSAAYLLWYAMFNFDKTVLIAANKNSNAMEMILRIRFAYEHLPFWLKPGVKDDGWNKHEIGFDNDSRIISTATSEDAGRGLSISLLFLDEFAFVKANIQDEFWTSMVPTLSTGGSVIVTSTPNGDMNIFAQIWRGAQAETNGFFPIKVDWDEPPDRDEAFKQEQIGKIGERKWNQEYLCQFLSSEALLIDSLFLINLSPSIEAIVPTKIVNDVIFFDDIKPTYTYLVGVDPSSGSGEDFSVITVYEFPTLKQVAEYRSNTMSPKAVYTVLKNVLMYLESKGNTVYFSIENNGVGQGIIALYDADENILSNAEFVSETGKDKLGFTTTAKSKMRGCVSLKEMLEKDKMEIRSKILLAELKSYVRRAGAYAAQLGATDDCISATLVIFRLIEEMAVYEQAAFDKLYSGNIDQWSLEDWDGYDNYDEEDEGLPILL